MAARTSVAALAGDYLVFELGFRAHNTLTGSRNGRIAFEDDNASDLPEDETTTGSFNPWLETSHTVLRQHPDLTATAGSFSITGNSVGLRRAALLTATPSSFAVTGSSASLKKNYTLTATPAAFTLTGNDAELTYAPNDDKVLTAEAGEFTLSGNDANLTRQRVLVTSTGTFLLTGQDASLLHHRRLEAQTSEYVLTSADVLLSKSIAAPTARIPVGNVLREMSCYEIIEGHLKWQSEM